MARSEAKRGVKKTRAGERATAKPARRRSRAAADVQISAFISPTTKERFEKYVRATGLKKGRVIEAALVEYLQAVAELPADVLIPSRIVVTQKSWREIVDRLANPRGPTPAMRELMRGD